MLINHTQILSHTGAGHLWIPALFVSEQEEPYVKRKQTNLYPQLVIGLGAAAYFFVLLSDPVLATDMWTKAEDIMKDVYTKILGISTIAAIVTASTALLLMNFSKSGKTVDESRAWLKRIAITWCILNGLGFIMAYVSPFFAGGKWTS